MSHRGIIVLAVLLAGMRVSAAVDPSLGVINVLITGQSKSTAIVTYDTIDNGASFGSRTKIVFGTTAAYGYILDDRDVPAALTHHSWILTGLAANTTYHVCPQAVDPNDLTHVSPCNGSSNDYVFTTANAGAEPGPDPVPPTGTVDTTMPLIDGGTYSVTDCRYLQDQISAAAAQSSQDGKNYQVVIPAGTVCAGSYALPAKSGQGWVVIRTSTPDNLLPAPGTRMTPAQKSLLATIQDNSWNNFSDRTFQVGNACLAGEVNESQAEGVAFSPPVFDIMACQNGRWQNATPIGTGSSATDAPPASCNTGDWWFNPAEPYVYRRIWYCVSPNHLVNMGFRNDLGSSNLQNLTGAGLFALSGASYYRLIGIEIVNVPTPAAAAFRDMNYWNLVSMDPNTDHIIFDRDYIHGSGSPSKTEVGINLAGTNHAVVDSYIDEISSWFIGGQEDNGMGILIGYGPGPYLIRNNYIGAVGNSIFVADDGSSAVNLNGPPHDGQIIGNYLHIEPKFDDTTGATDGMHYTDRDLVEFKYGQRWLIQGNIFDGVFASTENEGVGITAGLRSAVGDGPYTQTTLSDILIKDNIFRNCANGVEIFSANSAPSEPEPLGAARIKVANNLFQYVDGSIQGSSVVDWPAGSLGFVYGGPTDVTFDHNTLYRNHGDFPSLSIFDPIDNADGHNTEQFPGVNFQFTNNVGNVTWDSCSGLDAQGSVPGTVALNGIFATRAASVLPSWIVQGNGFVQIGADGNNSCPSVYPANNTWASNSAGFTNPAAGDYSLGSSPFRGIATDGGDPGINTSELMAATATALTGGAGADSPNAAADGPLIYNVSAVSTTGSTATISWTTDWTATSQVQYGLTNSYDQTTIETDTQTNGCGIGFDSSAICGAGTGSHAILLSNLVQNTIYHYRVTSRQRYPDGTIVAQSSEDHTFTTAPPAVSGTPPSGVIQIVNKLSGKVLDVTGLSLENGAAIQQWDYLGGKNQKWELIPVDSQYYKIVNDNSGLVLDVTGASTQPGARIQQYTYLGGDNQKWQIVPVDGQYFEIVNKESGMALDVTGMSMADGALLQQYTYLGGDNQKWMFLAAAPDVYDEIVNKNSGKVLDVMGLSMSDGAHVQQWDYLGAQNQQWEIVALDSQLGPQYYKIVNRNSGKVLDVTGLSTLNGTEIQQWDYLGGDNQQWQIIAVDSQYSKIVNKGSGKALDVTNLATTDGALIQQWDYLGGDNQKWQIIQVQ